jgi:hypothetical protein
MIMYMVAPGACCYTSACTYEGRVHALYLIGMHAPGNGTNDPHLAMHACMQSMC